MKIKRYYNKLILIIVASFLSGLIFGVGGLACKLKAINLWEFFGGMIIYGFFILVAMVIYAKFHKKDKTF